MPEEIINLLIFSIVVILLYLYHKYSNRINTFSLADSAEAKDFTPIPDKGVVFVFRIRDTRIGGRSVHPYVPLPVMLTGRVVAKLRHTNFVRLELMEGGYTIGQHKPISFYIKAGEVKFIRQCPYESSSGPFYAIYDTSDSQGWNYNSRKTISEYYLVRPLKEQD